MCCLQVSSQQIFSVNKLYHVVFQSFFCIELFSTFFTVQVFQVLGCLRPGFSGSRLFQGPSQGSGSRFQKQPKFLAFENQNFILLKYFMKAQKNFSKFLRTPFLQECVSIFLRAIVLQTYSPTECINSSTCCFKSPTGLFYRFLVLQTVGPTQQQNYRYTGQDQYIASPTFCRTIDTLVKTSVS